MKIIVYRQGTGIAVITPTNDKVIKNKDGSVTNIIGLDLAMKDIPEGAEYKIIEDSELPKDRIFRNAWNYDLKEDIPKSKEIWKEKLRADRKPILEKLDVDFMRAMEENDEVLMLDITKAKQVLRDVTQLVDACKTIAGIKKVKV